MAIVGYVLPHHPAVAGFSQWTRNKQPVGVVATVTGASEGGTVLFYVRGAVQIAAATVNAAGEATLYNVDDGAYTAYEVTTGNAWSIVVSGATATVTPIASTGIAGFAYFG
jgi:hypothetical protein